MSPPGTETPRQLPLDLAQEPGRSRDELVLTPANAQAVALVDNWPDWPSPVVVLAGPAGAGKSHLAAIWTELSGAAALDASDLDAPARRAAIAAGAALVDDADRPGLDETGLFHLINEVRASGARLLLTARRFPGAWSVTLPDLASRLRAATTVEIAEPDEMLLAGVITKLFADRQLMVEPGVVSYLVRRIERSLDAAATVVEAIDQASLERGSRITRRLAGHVVEQMDRRQGSLDL